MNEYPTVFVLISGDGLLSMTEFQAHVGADFLFAEPLFNNYDVNKDQKLSVQEFVDNAYHAMNTNGILSNHFFN